jgi:integrase
MSGVFDPKSIMAGNEFPYRLAVLKDRNGDISKRWFVEFYAWDKSTNQEVRKLIYLKARFKTKKEREKEGLRICQLINGKLQSGFIIDSKPKKQVEVTRNKPILFKEGVILAAKNKRASTDREHSKSNYNMYEKALLDWIEAKGYQKVYLSELDPLFMNSFFEWVSERETKTGFPIGPRSYNNYVDITRRFFTILQTLKVIESNPITMPNKPTPEAPNYVMDRNEQEQILTHLKAYEEIAYYFAKWEYYSFFRPNELRFLKIESIYADRLHVPGKVGKMYGSDYIVLTHALNELIEETGLRNMPKSAYVFGLKGFGSKEPVSRNYFSEKHRAITKKLGLNDRFTLYSWKDTGIVDLYNQTKDIHFVSRQARHHSLEYTQIYLQDRGAMLDFDKAGNTPRLPH